MQIFDRSQFVLFQEPRQTPYDLKFSFLGFPVRVHPAFFIMPIILGQSIFQLADMLGVNMGVTLMVLTVVFFISILVHELGHTLAFRYFGIDSRILLYWMGGLAIPDSFGSWSGASNRSLNSNQQIVVSLAGPAAGFLLAALFIAIVLALGGEIRTEPGFIPTFVPDMSETEFAGNGALFIFLFMGIWVNVFWNILNLAPIYPLDGGQAARELFMRFNYQNGLKYSLITGVVVGVLIALHGIQSGSTFMAFFFGYMAYTNYQMLNAFGGYGGGRPW